MTDQETPTPSPAQAAQSFSFTEMLAHVTTAMATAEDNEKCAAYSEHIQQTPEDIALGDICVTLGTILVHHCNTIALEMAQNFGGRETPRAHEIANQLIRVIAVDYHQNQATGVQTAIADAITKQQAANGSDN